jgi:hypothetical protein
VTNQIIYFILQLTGWVPTEFENDGSQLQQGGAGLSPGYCTGTLLLHLEGGLRLVSNTKIKVNPLYHLYRCNSSYQD